ncbi:MULTISPECIES: cupredoxin domain-containing protein [Haloprofundus]|uniref:cupredoxin domain-containing protein n=1 Tax=Haloprofundus TaxID=1911573 RepID=UPI000E436307|nr:MULTISPECIES: plastocyanin/azurin family copper-binding protein [Haloprofundus]QCJ47867.1 halocyanin [Haloprofundus sp. MHR1]
MNRRAFLAAAGATGLTALAGCNGVSGQGDDYDVGMTATAFDPPEVTISVGEEVVWQNTSTRDHTVTAYENSIPEEAEYFATGGFENEQAARDGWRDLEGALNNGDTFAHTFEVPGRYEYVCIPHETGGMVGTVVVEEGSESGNESQSGDGS